MNAYGCVQKVDGVAIFAPGSRRCGNLVNGRRWLLEWEQEDGATGRYEVIGLAVSAKDARRIISGVADADDVIAQYREAERQKMIALMHAGEAFAKQAKADDEYWSVRRRTLGRG